jgi:hypothetical protein
MTNESRSPLKAKPLRMPGQSLQEQRDKLFEDKLETPAMMAVFCVMLAGWEWSRYFTPRPPAPGLMSAIALTFVAFVAWRFWRVRPKLKALRLGLDGERVVGQFLERLREQGYHVFHDVVGTGFNVDHVIVGPAGVFTIETKTRSKPKHGNATVTFDGQQISIHGIKPDRDPVIQAKAQAAWLRQLLSDSTGRQFPVRPVIVFPGWYVEQSSGSTREVWVLEPKALPGFLEKESRVVSDEDVNLASFHLSRFIRMS